MILKKPKVLVIDDEPIIHDSIKYVLKDKNCEVVCVTSITHGVEAFSESPDDFVIAFIDHRLKQPNRTEELGIGIVPMLKAKNSQIETVMISGIEDSEVLKSWMKAGITRYLYKPLNGNHLSLFYDLSVDKWKSGKTETIDNSERSKLLKHFKMAGHSKTLLSALQVAKKAGENVSELPVLIMGESGTGKELIAKGIHKLSRRKDKNFIAVNCASFNGPDSSLLESELFGHEKGSFTGADKLKIGMLEEAMGGTIFLDEIQSLSPKSQEKLLRCVQEKKLRRVGGNKEIPFDARIISAGKTNLMDMAQNQEFLLDLFYRLNGIDVVVPPLRERKKDIDVLTSYFLEKENTGKLQKHFDSTALTVIRNHKWPGNVRELQMAVKRAHAVSDGETIEVSHLPKTVTLSQNDLGLKTVPQLKLDFEKQFLNNIKQALKLSKGNLSVSAKMLMIPRTDLRYKIKKLGIDLSKYKMSGAN